MAVLRKRADCQDQPVIVAANPESGAAPIRRVSASPAACEGSRAADRRRALPPRTKIHGLTTPGRCTCFMAMRTIFREWTPMDWHVRSTHAPRGRRARMEPTFGGINLEDIKAPECFYIEQKLRERMKIPVFHDDQHGTAIVAAAAVLNGLKLVGKNIAEIKLVCSGAGAAALACLDLIASLGLKRFHTGGVAGSIPASPTMQSRQTDAVTGSAETLAISVG